MRTQQYWLAIAFATAFMALLGFMYYLESGAAQEPDSPGAAISTISLVGPENDSANLGKTRLNFFKGGSIRALGVYEDVAYFVGLRTEDNNLCLAARRGVVEDQENPWNFEAATCAEIDVVKEHGAGLLVTIESTPNVMAYLLPDGYEESAKRLTWGTLVSANLVVVTDFDDLPDQETLNLTSSIPGQSALSLRLLSVELP
jgi:hypothetical protein